MARILVTGAAGFIGSHLAERLAALGHEVLGVDCLTDYYAIALKRLTVADLAEKGIPVLEIDLARDDLSACVQDVEMTYHLAAQPGISTQTGFEAYLRNNIIATQRLLTAVQRSRAFRGFINVCTSSAYGSDASRDESAEPKPTSYYGVTKLAAEQLVLAFTRDQGVPACSLRLFSVYGPRERPEKLYPRLIGAILEDKEFPLYEGSERHLRSFTYVSDIVDGMVAALDGFDACIGEIFNIGTDATFTTEEGIRTVEAILGKRARLRMAPKRPGDQLKTHANIEKARRVLGYAPVTTLREGLEKEVAWYRQRILGKIALWPEG
ncbi:MAG TPA: NAD-dependent epimerase/dehydratase family protein [Candidatus Hydrogenedentes bacterium]|nr:NAD-dependent epimerase/dehydratase family protein [Candidatus Hydrogenedentota bacterium]